MQTKQARVKIAIFALLTCLILTGCSASRFIDNMAMDQGTFNNIVSPDGDKDLNAEIEREKDAYGVEADAAKAYYDEKTGVMITETQYYAYNMTDNFKKYGLYVTIFFFAIGFLMRRFIHNSASLRKLGFVFEVCVPFVYILLAYVLSAVADSL